MNKINIAEILNNCPEGTKLYSPLFGKVEFYEISNNFCSTICVVDGNDVLQVFTKEGCYHTGYTNAECLLFPSSKMRDWRKFFKKGDVLYSEKLKMYAIFDSWHKEDYMMFKASILYHVRINRWEEEMLCPTQNFFLAEFGTEEVIKRAKILFGENFRPGTLQIKPVKPVNPTSNIKPFDKVLVRNNDIELWRCNIFSHHDTSNNRYPFVCIYCRFKQCIPYNEHTAHLLNTTTAYEEGGEK